MDISLSLYIPWWIVPALFLAGAVALFIRSYVKSRGEPAFIGEYIPIPNTVGVGSLIAGVVLTLIGLAFLGGHYLQ